MVSYRFQRHGYKAGSLSVQVVSISIYGRVKRSVVRLENFHGDSRRHWLNGSSCAYESLISIWMPLIRRELVFSIKTATTSEQDYHVLLRSCNPFINNAMTDRFAISFNVHERSSVHYGFVLVTV